MKRLIIATVFSFSQPAINTDVAKLIVPSGPHNTIEMPAADDLLQPVAAKGVIPTGPRG